MTIASNHLAAKKWRPSLGMIIIAILVLVLALPLVSLFFFRVYENHLVRQSEAELIAQSSVLAAMIAVDQYDVAQRPNLETSITTNNNPDLRITPHLDISKARVLPPRPKGRKISSQLSDKQKEIAARYQTIIGYARNIVPADILILDATGSIIAGGDEVGLSLAHISEISRALKGSYTSVVRQGGSGDQLPGFFSNRVNINIHTALPVVMKNQVIGVIYMSRQPKSVFTALYQQRYRLGLAAIIMVLATLIMGWVLTRAIAKPIHNLIGWTDQIGLGGVIDKAVSRHHGTRELAQLSDSFLAMSQKLIERSDYVSTFAAHVSHELKSPLTATRGAVELLLDDANEMDDQQRRKFLKNIHSDTDRLTRLVERLNMLATAENLSTIGACSINEIFELIIARFPAIQIDVSASENDQECSIGMSLENAEIIFSNLIENAVLHAANKVKINVISNDESFCFKIKDDGCGISSGNAGRVFEVFFTTRREDGGTGMGLALVRALLDAHGGRITLLDNDKNARGAAFEMTIPAV